MASLPVGRLRTIPYVDTSLTQYESSDKQHHIDYAVRWFKTIKIWDIGLSYFDGTSRDPTLIAGLNGLGQTVLIPRYDQLQQMGLDVQATIGRWLWKLEAVDRRIRTGDYWASVAGFEYTRSGFLKTRADVGWLMEYHYDSRQDRSLNPFDDDVMIGSRITFNDTASSQVLFGVIVDTNTREKAYFVEFSRRLRQSYTLNVELRAIGDADSGSALYSQRKNNFLQVELVKYF